MVRVRTFPKRKSKLVSRKRTLTKRRVVRRTGNSAPSRVSTVPSIGGFIAKGIKTLTSYLPGQSVIKPIVDFALKTFGYAEVATVTKNKFVGNVKILGVGGAFEVALLDVVQNDPKLGVRALRPLGHQALLTNYTEGKLLNVRFKVERSDPFQSSVGRWGVAFLPYRTASDADYYKQLFNRVPGFRDLDDIPGAVIGSSRVLELNFRPKLGRDGVLAQAMRLDNLIGAFIIAYDDVNRGVMEVTASEFSCIVTVSGAAVMLRPRPLAGYETYADGSRDLLGQYDMTLITSTYTTYNVKKTKDVTANQGLAHVEGVVVEAINIRSPSSEFEELTIN